MVINLSKKEGGETKQGVDFLGLPRILGRGAGLLGLPKGMQKLIGNILLTIFFAFAFLILWQIHWLLASFIFLIAFVFIWRD